MDDYKRNEAGEIICKNCGGGIGLETAPVGSESISSGVIIGWRHLDGLTYRHPCEPARKTPEKSERVLDNPERNE